MTERLVGRDRELAAVEAVLPPAGGQQRRVVELTGDPGAGKTRLLDEVLRRAAGRGLLVLHGRGSPATADLPYALVCDAVAHASVAEPRLAELGRMLDPGAAGAPAGDDSAPWSRYRLWARVGALLDELADERGLLLALDDVHDADSASRELLVALIRQAGGAPVVLLLADRPRQLHPQLATAIDQAASHLRVPLPPLREEDAAELLPALPADERRRVWTHSGGNPLYLLTLARRAASPDGSVAGAPDRDPLRTRIAAEIAGLPGSAQAVAHAAAVLGDPVDVAMLAYVSGLAEPVVAAALDDLAAADVLRSTPDGLRFRHPLVAAAAAAGAGPAWRAAAHARAAAAYGRAGGPLPIQAHHVVRSARRRDRAAVDVLERAAEQALHRAPVSAEAWYAAARRVAPADDEPLLRRLDVAHATALGLAGRLLDSRALLHAVLPRLPAGDPLRQRAVAAAARTEHLLGSHEAAAALLRRELHTSRPDGGHSDHQLLVELAAAEVLAGRWEPALAAARAAKAGPGADPATSAAAAGVAALALFTAGSVAEARQAALAATAEVDGLGDDEIAGRLDSVVWLGWVQMFLGEGPTALRLQRRALGLARDRGLALLHVHLLVGQGSAHKWLGELPDALRCFTEAEQVARLVGSEHLEAMAATMIARAWTWLGDATAAERWGERAVGLASRRDDWLSRVAPAVLAQARLEAGRPDGVAEAVVAAGGGVDLPAFDVMSRMDWYHMLARAAAASDDPVAAKGWAERAMAGARDSAGDLPAAKAYALLAEAEAQLAAGAADAAVERALEARRGLAAAGNRLDAARADLLAGRALATTGARPAALDVLGRAHLAFDECSAAALREQAARELRRLGRRVASRPAASRPAVVRSVPRLTPREAEVARLVMEGRTNRAIARALSLSEKTVERHLGHIFVKLGVSSRAALAAAVAHEAADA